MTMYQYFEDAIEPEARDLEHKVRFPSRTTFKGRRWAGWSRDSRETTIRNLDGRLIITHNDADGLVSGALFLDHFEDDEAEDEDSMDTEVITIDYENIEETFEYILEEGDDIQEVFVSDLNLDDVYPCIGDVADNVDRFVWLDHHEWGDTEQQVSDMGVDVTINRDRAAAGMVHEYITDHGYETSDTVEETVELTEDHDLWQHDMETITLGSQEKCISQAFSQMAFYSDTELFMEEILDIGGDFMEYEDELLRNDNGEGFIGEREDEHARKIQYVVDNLTTTKEIGGYTVAFSHGRGSPGQILEALIEQKGVDILIHTKPTYPVKASIRSADTFHRCHEIADALGGGGHEQAAGCKPEIVEEPLAFLEYIENDGQELQDAAERVLRDQLEE